MSLRSPCRRVASPCARSARVRLSASYSARSWSSNCVLSRSSFDSYSRSSSMCCIEVRIHSKPLPHLLSPNLFPCLLLSFSSSLIRSPPPNLLVISIKFQFIFRLLVISVSITLQQLVTELMIKINMAGAERETVGIEDGEGGGGVGEGGDRGGGEITF